MASMWNAVKTAFVGVDPKTQKREYDVVLRRNIRALDRYANERTREMESNKNKITAALRRAEAPDTDARRRSAAQQEVRNYAMAVATQKKLIARIVTAKAQLESVQRRIDMEYMERKTVDSIGSAVKVLHKVNQRNPVPQLVNVAQALSVESIKADVIEEMVGENLPLDEDGLMNDEVTDEEIQRVLDGIRQPKKATSLPSAPVVAEPESAVPAGEEEEDQEVMMNQMRNRLEALRS
ncbi:charged multivesicular body protein 3 [Xylariaceae sp. FL0594]|nr:charged multivesicular body protein 3 [Xylariaceae sp. FL0594]